MQSFIFLVVILPLVNGFCHQSSGRVDKTVTGRLIPVCSYKGLDILDGSSFRTADCMDCKCRNSGQLSCCGYGINSGVYLAPVGCKVIADGCDPIFVLQSDETRDCKTGKKIDLTLKPEIIQPSFPGMYPSNMFPNTRLPDLRDMLRKGMNYQYNYHSSKNVNPFVGEDTTGNSLRDFMFNNGLFV
ncbi:uncharacterized protein [Mytilus edulis]|uniref:uncharacterized protein n=1 Tax=Mytilus edulis TaxID=6550 RepID=UPI0039EF0C74